MLDVDAALLNEWGAVSEQVAAAMAEGALKNSQAQYSLAITGIAGPDGGTVEKTVGTVCFGWAWLNPESGVINSITTSEVFAGDREAVRNQSAFFSLQKLHQLMVEYN